MALRITLEHRERAVRVTQKIKKIHALLSGVSTPLERASLEAGGVTPPMEAELKLFLVRPTSFSGAKAELLANLG